MASVLTAHHFGRKLFSDGPEDSQLSSYVSSGLNMMASQPGIPIPGVASLTQVRSHDYGCHPDAISLFHLFRCLDVYKFAGCSRVDHGWCR